MRPDEKKSRQKRDFERIRGEGRQTDRYGEEAGRPDRNGRQKRGGNKKNYRNFPF
jgi:hypothetical protein